MPSIWPFGKGMTREADASSEEPQLGVLEALLSPRPSDIFLRWARTGRLADIMPDLDALRGVTQLPAHRDDAFIHTLKVVDAIEPTSIRRWAGLLHDIGKGPTFIETPDGRSRFFEHDRIGAEMTLDIMPAAGEGPERTEQVRQLVSLHMRPISYNPQWTDSAVRRLREEAEEGRGEEGWRDLLALSRADLRGYLPEPIDRGLWVLDQLEARCEALLEGERTAAERERLEPRSPLDGTELLLLGGREPGPWIAILKDYLCGEVEGGRLGRDDKERARQLALAWLQAQPDGSTE